MSATWRDRSLWGWAGFIVRLGLGLMWIAAGWPKLMDPGANIEAVRAYEILPWEVADVVGRLQPVAEIALGVLLLVGLFTRWTAALSAVLLLVFIAGIGSAWARGLRLDCGCFSAGGALAAGEDPVYGLDIARDTALFLLAAFLVWRPRTPLALDALLRR